MDSWQKKSRQGGQNGIPHVQKNILSKLLIFNSFRFFNEIFRVFFAAKKRNNSGGKDNLRRYNQLVRIYSIFATFSDVETIQRFFSEKKTNLFFQETKFERI